MKPLRYRDAIAFHGHSCQGLAIGYRVAKIAMAELLSKKAADEELVAVVENDSCSVDAIQALCGCTFGKGNLFFKDFGKHAYTFFNRASGKSIRIYVEPFYLQDRYDARFVALIKKKPLTRSEKEELNAIKRRRINAILRRSQSGFIKMSPGPRQAPAKARVFSSKTCCRCGESVMATRIVKSGGKSLCLPCLHQKEAYPNSQE